MRGLVLNLLIRISLSGAELSFYNLGPNSQGGGYRVGASGPPCTTHASGQPLLYKASRLYTASFLHLGMQLLTFISFLTFSLFCPFFLIRGFSSNFLDGGASVQAASEDTSRHCSVPSRFWDDGSTWFPSITPSPPFLFLSIFLCIILIQAGFVVGPQESNLYFCRQW